MANSVKHLHIISFDIPYPADYGGVIDVFYKIKSLYELGVKIHLHAYEYGRDHAPQLEEYCETVHYYNRANVLIHLFKKKPYIVSSRESDELVSRLMKDDYPILFEGLHTCAILSNEDLKSRLKLVRTHNIEHEYYHHLSLASHQILQKIYYKQESRKLAAFESQLQHANHILAISKSDEAYFKEHFNDVTLLPAFHSGGNINSVLGQGDYLVYHGNLSVEENEKAALFLIKEVFSKIQYPCMITGKNPSADLESAAAKFQHIKVHKNPSSEDMDLLIREAQINILPTFQDTGIKLKLLKSISEGRFCIANSLMVANTGLEDLCSVFNEPKTMIEEIHRLMPMGFTQDMIEKRVEVWNRLFSNTRSAQQIVDLIKA